MRNYRLIAFILGLGVAVVPASATITYSACTAGNGCTADGTGTYANWQAAGPSLTFTSLLTFSSANLSGGVYTDPGSGVVFTNYTTGGSVDTFTHVNGTSLTQGNNGSGSGFEIDLPANTFAIALDLVGCNTTCSSFSFMFANGSIGTQSSHTGNYGMTLPNGGPPQFFGLVSDTAITAIFVASSFSSGQLTLSDFEIGTSSGDTGGATPEPSTVVTLGGGLGGLYFWHRRRSRARRSV